jgi:aminopeptidase N
VYLYTQLLRTEIGGDSTLWHFKTTPPLPPYLFAVVAGRYHAVERKHGDIPMAIWCRDSLATWIDQQADEIFEITASGLDFFEQYFAMTYPFDEYNQIFVPELKFGAMENPGCVIFNENRIHRGQATEVQLQVRAETILHEMAHAHGFGDVTTMRWWGDLWLNETFATYKVCAIGCAVAKHRGCCPSGRQPPSRPRRLRDSAQRGNAAAGSELGTKRGTPR